MKTLSQDLRDEIEDNGGFSRRTLYKTGNFDLYNEDFKWVNEIDIETRQTPADIYYFERLEWGPFIGSIKSLHLDDKVIDGQHIDIDQLEAARDKAVNRRQKVKKIERKEISDINYRLEEERLELRRVEMANGKGSNKYKITEEKIAEEEAELMVKYERLQEQADILKAENQRFYLVLNEVGGLEKTVSLSDIVRYYPANRLNFFQKLGVYFSRWGEFLTAEPREANTEGGVMPAIFGTFCMTILLVIAVAPFGVVAALYLREYAKQGHLVSVVRICVNNLSGVPSIVYGVFGLGFFAYTIGGSIDALFFSEKLPNPTFGTGGLLWASLTLALLTVPVVIVATEEALAAVPQSLREGSLACGASKWQTIKNVVLPKAAPGILTGLILAMARGAGEVAPLMLVGVVKMAPELPLDGHFPFIHLQRSFMHLGFHIFDVGFQSRNAEAGKPMVFVTTLLLIFLVAAMNATAIYIRNRLNRRFVAGHF